MNNPILGFKGDFNFLSNFYESPLVALELKWKCVENPYQFIKTGSPEFAQVYLCASPGQAKRLSRKNPVVNNWDDIKLEVMRVLIRKKFEQNPDLAEKLLATGDRDIVELNTWGDTYWGMVERGGKLVGKNHLGILLMNQRMALNGEGLLV